ncbi:hypothetical protein I302_104021 [Kwoniella bestiolae CBS 10118]|uniref:Capsular associated protein n=1 Tax=Kwoniella bestiolae CBS 10118 TaxID=1296100 RepID=A0A1B9GA20_9TREE|nr:hypothetical protein I302_02726 [Kwoniella bestiolae CBS 10118]OCF27876.1 hypothetical protein I302_02726 [Kwoniella bestiolae CBS 10118]
MDKRIPSPFSQALYAVEVLTDRLRNLGAGGVGLARTEQPDRDRDQEDSYRLLSYRDSIHEPTRPSESTDLQNDEEENESPPPYDIDSPTSPTSPGFPVPSHSPSVRFRIDYLLVTIILLAIGSTLTLFVVFPFPTTIPAFIGLLTILVGWTSITWMRVLYHLSNTFKSKEKTSNRSKNFFNRFSNTKRTVLVTSTLFILFLSCLGFCPPEEKVVPTRPYGYGTEKYFVAANLHNSEDILPRWSSELIKLIDYLGTDNVHVSIYESNSQDSTKSLLSSLNQTLQEKGVGRTIITEQDDKHWWPYNTSPERIGYLANARNKALIPIQSDDPSIRLEGYNEFTKIIFLNDVYFTWGSMVRLINTKIEGRDEYDQVCAMDFGTSGLYDTWASRDICGTPLRPFWPYVKDEITIEKLRKEEPFEVSSCWNGAVVFKAGPFLYKPKETDVVPEEVMEDTLEESESGRHMMKRGWKMVDNPTYPNSVFSPSLTLPIQFRTSNISACDHSECFLIGYDLHRLYDTVDRPPRIYMNPTVKLAYEKNWYVWHNSVLRIPVVQWWLENWSRGYPFYFVDWIWEKAGRRRDYCTWSALAVHLPYRCPSLPGAVDKNWDQ